MNQIVLIALVFIFFSPCIAGFFQPSKAANQNDNKMPCTTILSAQINHFMQKYGIVHAEKCGESFYNIEIFKGKVLKGTPAEIANKVLVDASKACGFNTMSMQKIIEMKGPTGTRIKYYQTYKGIQIFDTSLLVTIDQENRVTQVQSKTKNNIFVDTKPQIDQQHAMKHCEIAHHLRDKMSLLDAPRLMVYTSEKEPTLAWRFVFTANEPSGAWESLISATDGRLLMSQKLLDE